MLLMYVDDWPRLLDELVLAMQTCLNEFIIPVMVQPPIPVNPKLKKKSINWKIDVNNHCLCLLLFRHHWTLSQNLTPLFKRLNGRYEWLHIHGIKISHYWCSVKRNVILQYGYIRVFFLPTCCSVQRDVMWISNYQYHSM